MKLYESMIANAKPKGIRSNIAFTERVMNTIQEKNPKKSLFAQFIQSLHKNPAIAVLIAVASVITVAGATYAAVQLWPQTQTHLNSVNEKDGATNISVLADNCGVNKEKRYGVKTGATVTPESAPMIVAAECNLASINLWAQKTYPELSRANSEIGAQLPKKPGTVVKGIAMPASPMPAKIVAVTSGSITIEQTGGAKDTLTIEKNTKAIIRRQYATPDKLKVGDTVAVLVAQRETMKADPSCTDTTCHYSIVEGESKRSLLMVATLDQPLEYYQSDLRYQIYELDACVGNRMDDCTLDTASIELFTSYQTEDRAIPQGTLNVDMSARGAYQGAQIQGKIVSWDESTIIIKTSSGRNVTVHAGANVIGMFNNGRASQYGYTISIGDTITVNYAQQKGSENDSIISTGRINGIDLRVSTLNKGDRQFKKL